MKKVMNVISILISKGIPPTKLAPLLMPMLAESMARSIKIDAKCNNYSCIGYQTAVKVLTSNNSIELIRLELRSIEFNRMSISEFVALDDFVISLFDSINDGDVRIGKPVPYSQTSVLGILKGLTTLAR